MKPLVIIIPGVKSKDSLIFKSLFHKFCSHFGVEIGDDSWTIDLKEFFEKNTSMDVKVFKWNGGISKTFSVLPAARKLASIIDKTDHKRIILFGKSFGGLVAENAIRKAKSSSKVFELIYVATPHRRCKADVLKSIKILNLFSPSDKMEDLANEVLYLDMGKEKLENAKNICLKNLKHSDFNHNVRVFHNGKHMKLFDFYAKLLSGV